MREVNENNKYDIDSMIGTMSSFYIEHLPIDSTYRVWLDKVVDAWKGFREEILYVHDCMLPENTPTLKNYLYYKLSMKPALYGKDIAKQLLKEHETIEGRVLALNELGFFVEFEFTEINPRPLELYSLELTLDFERKTILVQNEDYIIRKNKIFLLPEFVLDNNQLLGEVHAYDVKANNFALELNWGNFFPAEAQFLVPRFEYKTFVEAYFQLMNSKFFIRDMKEAIQKVQGRDTTEIYDVASRALPEHYKAMYDEYYLSPLDFIVRLDYEAIYDKVETNMILHMIMTTKEAHVFFWMIYAILREDEFEAKDDYFAMVMMPYEFEFEAKDDYFALTRIVKEEHFFCGPYYDQTRSYDRILYPYDIDYEKWRCGEIFMPAIFDDPDIFMDQQFGEHDEVFMDKPQRIAYETFEIEEVSHPEIPREFKLSGKVINFKMNSWITDSYSIYGSADGKEYEKLGEVKHVKGGGRGSFRIPDDKYSKMKYYKMRANERLHRSLFTKIEEV